MTYLYYIVAIIIAASDQLIKSLVVKNMVAGESIPIVNGIFYITSSRNRGAAFGILQNQHWLFAVITIAVAVGVAIFLRRSRQRPFLSLAASFLLGGAIGNFIDRMTTGEVVDYLDVYIGSYHYPIFNLADSFIVISVIMILIDALFLQKGRAQRIQAEESK